jgi:ABC-type multidrug transport system ATPase subunit
MPAAQQRAIVEDVLEILDLQRIRNSVVGSPEKRGISGGQKKRVNIGMELVAYPRVLFLDEPTSGLDSSSSLQVARCLQRMRSLGITVVTVIHQPRWSVFRCFSHCLLLAKGGKTVYLGSTGFIQGYFEKLGFTLPPGENVADWFIDIVSGQTVRDGEQSSDFLPERDLPKIWKERGQEVIKSLGSDSVEIARANSLIATSEESIQAELSAILNVSLSRELSVRDVERLCKINGVDASPDTVASLHGQFRDSCPQGKKLTVETLASVIHKNSGKQTFSTSSPPAGAYDTKLVNRTGPSFGSQLNSLISRNVAKFNTTDLLLRCLIATLGAIIVTFASKGALDYSMIPVNNQSGLLLFAIISGACYMYVFGEEKLVFSRESQTGISVTAYWLAKNTVNLLDIIVITLYYYTFYFALLQNDYTYGEGLSTFLLLAWYCSGVSHFFSVTMGTANGLLLAVMLPAVEITILSGVKPTMSSATNFQKFLNYIGIGYYSVEDLSLFEVRSLPENVQQLPAVTNMMSTYAYAQNHLTRNSLISLALGIVVRLVTLATLMIKVYGWPGSHQYARLKLWLSDRFSRSNPNV